MNDPEDQLAGVVGHGEKEASQDHEARLAQAMDEYLEALEAGQRPDREALLKRHSDIAEELTECLDGIDFIHNVAPQLGASVNKHLEEFDPRVLESTGTKCLGDYRILGEVGRGGMGVVYEAEQVSLSRKVALKVLPFAAMLDQKQLQRFQNEARAAASLDHPNIVSVHSVGFERGIHFYTMQFIEGRTLAQVISELRRDGELAPQDEPANRLAQSGAKASPSADTDRGAQAQVSTQGPCSTPEFFRSIARLGIQAAEALEHAHQMGVVHRDVKPSNLMVDASGHLWITDFGLAMTQSDTNLTMTGDVLGTLRYMSPEQAAGKSRALDHHTDIYSLGVTLYELLTLQPAFAGDDRQKLLRDISEVDPRPPRQINRSIPVDLETIVAKATSKEVKDRYATAQELAEDLQRFLDGKPIQAHRPSLLGRAAKWRRRHRSVVAAAAAILVVTTISLAISTALITAAAYREAEQAKLASNQRDRARANVRLALLALDEIYIDVAAERFPRKAHLSPADRALLEKALRFYEALAKQNDQEPTARAEMAKAYRRVGDIQLTLGENEEAERAYRRSVECFRRLADDFPANPASTYGTAASFNNLGTSLWNQGRSEEAEQAYRRALDLSKTLCDRSGDEPAYREELARSHNNLAVLLVATDRRGQAEKALLEASEAWRRLAQDSPRAMRRQHRLASCLANLANVWMEMKRYEEAEKALAQALEIGRTLVLQTPQRPEYQELLARALNSMGVLARDTRGDQDAKPFFSEALPRWRALAQTFPGVPEYEEELKRTSQNLLRLLDKQDDDEESLQQALALRMELADRFLQSGGYHHELARTQPRLAVWLTKHRRLPEAQTSYGQAIALWEALRQVSTDAGPYQNGLAGAYNNLGVLCRASGQTVAAAEAYRKAVNVMEELAGQYGANPAFRESLAKTWHNLGLSLGTSQPEEARDALDQARLAFQQLADAHGDEPKYQVDLAAVDTALGSLLVTMGRHEDAQPLLHEAVELRRSLAEQFPDDAAHQNSLAWLLANSADPALRDPPLAVETAERAVELDPQRPPFWNTLGAAHFRAGDWASAIEALRKSIELSGGDDGSDWLFLAMAHWQSGDKDEARKCYDRAVEWIDRQRPHDAEMSLLRDEASRLLGIDFDTPKALHPSAQGRAAAKPQRARWITNIKHC